MKSISQYQPAIQVLVIAGLVLLGIALIGLGPVLTIVSLNALFQLNIALTFFNWLAVVWLSMVAHGIASVRVKLNQ